MEFDILKKRNSFTNPDPARDRAPSTVFQDIIDEMQGQENEEIKHEFEDYENIDIDDFEVDITLDSLKELKKIKNKVKDKVDIFQKHKAVNMIREKKHQLEKALNSSKIIRSRDKVIFIYSWFALHTLVYLLGSHPGKYFLYWMALSFVGYFITRLYLLSLEGKKAIMLEFSYFCSIILTIFLLLFPQSQALYQFCFCASSGFMCFSIYYLVNSLIMHKMSSVSDLFIKLGPVILMWNIHWNLRGTEERKTWNFYDPANENFSLGFIINYIIYSSIFYCLWSVPYFLLVPGSGQRYGDLKVLKQLGETKGKLLYILFHYLVFIISGLTLGLSSYYSQVFHLSLIGVTSSISFYNGGRYYMEYFGKAYEINLSSLEEKDKKEQ